MPKTPDEIKKGLECCATSYADCHKECPYKPDCDGSQILKDALALIQQLQAKNADLIADNGQLLIEVTLLNAKVERLEAERDAAVRDLTEMAQDTDESCEYCEMFETPHCSLECRMKNKGFKWRGVQKEGCV